MAHMRDEVQLRRFPVHADVPRAMHRYRLRGLAVPPKAPQRPHELPSMLVTVGPY